MQPEITQEAREALQRFSAKHGRYWKSKLIALWVNGQDDRQEDGGTLRRLRNTIGPTGLQALRLEA